MPGVGQNADGPSSYSEDRKKTLKLDGLERRVGRRIQEGCLSPVEEVTFDPAIPVRSDQSEKPDEPASTAKKRMSTAEVLVALSTQQSRKSVELMRRRSMVDGGDPLKANVLLFKECCNLIHKNQRALCFNVFLVLLVVLILSSILVFAFLAPPRPLFEIDLSAWASFSPQEMRLLLVQPGREDELTLRIGRTEPPLDIRLPSFCECHDEPADCAWPEDGGRCWCFKWRGELRLRLVNRRLGNNTDCLLLRWNVTSAGSLRLFDCFRIDRGGVWYGGAVTSDQRLTLNFSARNDLFVPYLTNDIQGNQTGLLTAAQPFWMSNRGFGLSVGLSHPIVLRQSENEICIKTGSESRMLKYAVCRTDDVRELVRHVPTINSLLDEINCQPSANQSESLTPGNITDLVLIRKNASEASTDELVRLSVKAKQLKSNIGVIYENFDLFNQSMAQHFVDIYENASSLLSDTSVLTSVVDLNGYLRMNHLEDKQLQKRCIVQQVKNNIGITWWRGNNYACLDLTAEEIRQWFVNVVTTHPVISVVQYVSLAGGDAASLPLQPELQLRDGQSNYFSSIYARTAASLPGCFSTETGYGTQRLRKPMLLNLYSQPGQVRSLIPTLLTLSLQGYSRLSLTLYNHTLDGQTWLPFSKDSLELYTWLTLAMFLPVFRLPEEVLEWEGYEQVLNRFRPLREPVALARYAEAERRLTVDGEPIFKPIWWQDFAIYQADTSAIFEKIWENDQQFMIGDDLLVAASFRNGHAVQQIYLPSGYWRNPETQKIFLGNQMVSVDTAENVVCFERYPDPVDETKNGTVVIGQS